MHKLYNLPVACSVLASIASSVYLLGLTPVGGAQSVDAHVEKNIGRFYSSAEQGLYFRYPSALELKQESEAAERFTVRFSRYQDSSLPEFIVESADARVGLEPIESTTVMVELERYGKGVKVKRVVRLASEPTEVMVAELKTDDDRIYRFQLAVPAGSTLTDDYFASILTSVRLLP